MSVHLRILVLWSAAVTLAAAVPFSAPVQDEQPSARVLLAGAAASNITPPLGSQIVGGWEPIPATHVHDELYARCLVLDDGATRIAIVVVDNVGIPRHLFDAAKKLVEAETGLPKERMLMSATHTHSAASARGEQPLTRDERLDDYQQFVARRIADGVRRALNNLEPARVGWAIGQAPEHVFNRRWYLKEGTPAPNPFGGYDKVQMNPGSGPHLDRPAGPIDPEVSFLSVQARDGRPIALLANYSLHYVGGVRGADISADYFGIFAARLTELIGARDEDRPFVAMMSNGTSGDVNNINFRNPGKRYPPYEKMRIVGNAVAAEVYKKYQTVEYQDWVPIAMLQTELPIRFRVPTGQQLSYARQVQAKPESEKPHNNREKIYAERVLAMANYPPELPMILQSVRIGDLGIGAIPAEVFVEIGLELKQKSPFGQTFVMSLANGSYGYLPTPEHHTLGGYETWLGTNRVEVEASRKITDQLLKMFNQLSRDNSTRSAESPNQASSR
jgi:neutral ceramidase